MERFRDLRVTVIGDALLDSFVDCTPSKLCSEGPVPVVWRRRESSAPGGAANVAANMAALGARVRFVGVIGADDTGRSLRDHLERLGVGVDTLLEDAACRTHLKTRILADGHYVVRVDEGETRAGQRLLPVALDALAGVDALVLSDYGLGVLDDRLVRQLAARRPSVPVVVDAKRPARFRRARPTAVTPNLEEATALAGGEAPLDRLARRVRRATAAEVVALTLGDRGAYLHDGLGDGELVPPRPGPTASEIGAGDSFAAALALSLGVGASPRQAVAVAVEAAGIAVGKPRTAVVRAEELARSLALVGDAPERGAYRSAGRAPAALTRERRRHVAAMD